MEKLHVRAVSDPVPTEGGLDRITTEPISVPNSYYYRQLLQANALEEVEPVKPKASKSSTPEIKKEEL
ncbi:MAG TPA: hypothetical protein PKY05_00240 [Fibrobacteria bacterium]|nr:hypothetical protein [Fibrobacteria bacterium]